MFSQTEVEPPVSGWTRKTIGDYFISFDSENLWAFSQKGDNWVALLGKAIDILHWTMDFHDIVSQCLDRLSYSEDRMLDYIDYLSGRFILIYHHNDLTKLMSDAFGNRSTFYSFKRPTLIASHCRIISDYLQSPTSRLMAAIRCDDEWKLGTNFGYPGNLTPFEDVYLLTPNTLINVEERKIQRFYPRRELGEGNLDEVVEEVSVLLKRQLELLHSEYKLVISLSAGIDTRTTLAVARDIAKDTLFFTYGDPGYLNDPNLGYMADAKLASSIARFYEWRRRVLETDLLVASEMAQVLELHHICLADATACEEDFEEFNQILDCNTYYSHARRLARTYLDAIPQGLLHIRSNVSELAKAYRRPRLAEFPLTPEKMAQQWKRMATNKNAVEAFLQFAEVTDFSAIHNYDPYDMFLWEHHEGTWLPCVLLESDLAFDTFELFNCRILAEKVLSVPPEQRTKSAIHYGIIKRLWPLLLLWPINELPFKLQLEELRADHTSLEAEVRELEKELAKQKGTVRGVRGSFSYKLGNTLVQAAYKPGRNTIFLPYRLIRLCYEESKKRKAM